MHMNAVAEGEGEGRERAGPRGNREHRSLARHDGYAHRRRGRQKAQKKKKEEEARRCKKKIKKYARQFSMAAPHCRCCCWHCCSMCMSMHMPSGWKKERERRGERECNCGALLVSATAVTKRRITTNCELQVSAASSPLTHSLSFSLALPRFTYTVRWLLFAFAMRCLRLFAVFLSTSFFAYAFFTLFFGMLS